MARRKSDSTIVDVVFVRSESLSVRGARAVLNQVRRHRMALDRIEDALRNGAPIRDFEPLLVEYANLAGTDSTSICDTFYALPAVQAATDGMWDR